MAYRRAVADPPWARALDDRESPWVETVLTADQWRPLAAAHAEQVHALLAGHLARVAADRRHPVEDFLFDYYRLRPAQLAQWHPGAGIGLLDAADIGGRFYRTDSSGVTAADLAAFVGRRRPTVEFVIRLQDATAEAPAQFGCFGLHEWAMVYRQSPQDRRHSSVPLRLGAAGTDAVVEANTLRCSHFDAFRFFTPDARPRNAVTPEVFRRTEMEQPGCLHGNMDLYKWAYKMLPVVPSTLVLDCFRLARDIREVDMRASPYDLADLGYPPIPIETTAGKAQYVAEQRAFADRAAVLRDRLRQALVPAAAALGVVPRSPDRSRTDT